MHFIYISLSYISFKDSGDNYGLNWDSNENGTKNEIRDMIPAYNVQVNQTNDT